MTEYREDCFAPSELEMTYVEMSLRGVRKGDEAIFWLIRLLRACMSRITCKKEDCFALSGLAMTEHRGDCFAPSELEMTYVEMSLRGARKGDEAIFWLIRLLRACMSRITCKKEDCFALSGLAMTEHRGDCFAPSELALTGREATGAA
jgi:hypothetical protein